MGKDEVAKVGQRKDTGNYHELWAVHYPFTGNVKSQETALADLETNPDVLKFTLTGLAQPLHPRTV